MGKPFAGVDTGARDDPHMRMRERLPSALTEVDGDVEVGPGACPGHEPEEAPEETEPPGDRHLMPCRHDLTRVRDGLAVLDNHGGPASLVDDLLWRDHAAAEAERAVLDGFWAIEDGTCSNHDAPHLPVLQTRPSRQAYILYHIICHIVNLRHGKIIRKRRVPSLYIVVFGVTA